MACSGAYEQEKEHAADWDIRYFRGRLPKRLCLWWVWRAMFLSDLPMQSACHTAAVRLHLLTCPGDG